MNEDCFNRQPDDADVEPDAPVLHIPDVTLHAPLHLPELLSLAPIARHLRPTRHTRLHKVAHHILIYQLRILFRMCRDRDPEEEELKSFVEATLAKGDTREAVLKKFVRSDEFTKYCEGRKINRGDINIGGWSTNYDGFKIYINPDSGLMERGYTTVNGIPCYFDNDGTLRTDWSDLASVVPESAQLYSFSAMEKDITKPQQAEGSIRSAYVNQAVPLCRFPHSKGKDHIC